MTHEKFEVYWSMFKLWSCYFWKKIWIRRTRMKENRQGGFGVWRGSNFEFHYHMVLWCWFVIVSFVPVLLVPSRVRRAGTIWIAINSTVFFMSSWDFHVVLRASSVNKTSRGQKIHPMSCTAATNDIPSIRAFRSLRVPECRFAAA